MEAIRRYKLFYKYKLEGIFTEQELADRFNLSIQTIRVNVANNKRLTDYYFAETTEDEIVGEKAKPTDPKVMELLREWDEVTKVFKKSSAQEKKNVL